MFKYIFMGFLLVSCGVGSPNTSSVSGHPADQVLTRHPITKMFDDDVIIVTIKRSHVGMRRTENGWFDLTPFWADYRVVYDPRSLYTLTLLMGDGVELSKIHGIPVGSHELDDRYRSKKIHWREGINRQWRISMKDVHEQFAKYKIGDRDKVTIKFSGPTVVSNDRVFGSLKNGFSDALAEAFASSGPEDLAFDVNVEILQSTIGRREFNTIFETCTSLSADVAALKADLAALRRELSLQGNSPASPPVSSTTVSMPDSGNGVAAAHSSMSAKEIEMQRLLNQTATTCTESPKGSVP